MTLNIPCIHLDSSKTDFWTHCASASEIVFTKADGTTKLKREVEEFDHTADNLLVWVKIPEMNASSDLDIYLYYGNASGSETDDTDTWDTNYRGVWHLLGDGTLPDATSYSNVGTKVGTANTASGQIDGAQVFDGNDYIEVAHHSSLDLTTDIAVEAWVYMDSFTTSPCILSKGSGGTTQYWMDVRISGTQFLYGAYTAAGGACYSQADYVFETGKWYHLAWTYNKERMIGYIDGVEKGNEGRTCTFNSNGDPVRIGSRGATSQRFDGTIDEVRISASARSGDWIKTGYNNQNSPGVGGFLKSIGSEEECPPTVNSVTLADASLTPQMEYTVTVNVSDAGGKADLDTLVLKVYYDSDGGAPSVTEHDDQTAHTQTCAIITWTQGGTFVMTPDPATCTWALGSCTEPATLADDFTFKFTPGKVATETSGDARWQITAKVTDDGIQTDFGCDDTPPTMNWYGEITVNTGSVNWDTVALGSDFTPQITPTTGISVTYICNGGYNQQVKADSPWTNGGGASVTLGGESPGAGEFSLKADDTATLGSAVLVSTSYVTIDSGSQTDESGNTESANTLWLKLGASGIPDVTYSGDIHYQIAQ